MVRRRSLTFRRALVAALVLYAVMVQALLAGWSPAFAGPLGRMDAALCQHEPGDDHPGPGSHGTPCCVAACLTIAGPTALPTGSSPIVWPARAVSRVVRTSGPALPRARPGSPLVNARGPPPV